MSKEEEKRIPKPEPDQRPIHEYERPVPFEKEVGVPEKRDIPEAQRVPIPPPKKIEDE